MSKDQMVFVALAFIILLAITLAAQFRWLPEGRTKTALVFLAGVAVVVALWLARMPPAWFEGSGTGFGLALSFVVGAFLPRTADGKAFGLPLLLGMGLSLGVANVVAFLTRHL